MWTYLLISFSSFSLYESTIPLFTTPGAPGRTIPVSETTPPGQSVYRVVAIDADSDVLIYSLTSQAPPNPQKFSISSTSGVISTMAEFDVDVDDAIEEYEISVRVTDGSSNIETTMIMKITDENDNFPAFMNYHVIRETTKAGSIVANVKADDLDSGDNGVVVYKITGGNTNNAFGIDSSSGVLYTMYSLEYDTNALYMLTIEARDKGAKPKTSTTTMTLSLIENLRGGTERTIVCCVVIVVSVSFALMSN